MTDLELNEVSVHARGKALIEEVCLTLREGDFVALLGPNGAGKTTLLRAALGLMPISGSALLAGRAVRDIPGRERAGLAAWLPQQALVLEAISSLDLVTAARFRFNESRASAEQAARTALEHTGAGEFANRLISRLSGGEQQRVAVAALLAQEAPLLLLDEPANHLDPAQQISLYALFGRLWREGRGILCITHDVNMLRHVGAGAEKIRVVGMSGGRVKFEAAYGSEDLAAHIASLFDVAIDAVQSQGRRLLIPLERA
jgi:iron complex transport system ATP-binding protein